MGVFPGVSTHFKSPKSQILSAISLFSFPNNYGLYFFKNHLNCGKICGKISLMIKFGQIYLTLTNDVLCKIVDYKPA